jgi:hypothetical protein
MNQVAKCSLDLSSEARSSAVEREEQLCNRWYLLRQRYLPILFEDSIWCYNRYNKPQEPSQGWKLHISATILEACDLFERIAPYLHSQDVQFKAPKSLNELSKVNCGLQYGYHQVGKFITVYPETERQAVRLAKKLHELTHEFTPINVPFDEQYKAGSSVFYRYGGFSQIEIANHNGEKFLAIENPKGEFVPDNRLQAVPEWLKNPFPQNGKLDEKNFKGTLLETTYRIFQAITQRGKGGTYLAIDLSQNKPRFCIVKEGRSNGEIGWDGQDGYFLVQNEFKVLSILNKKYNAVPKVFESFEIQGNYYFTMEYVDGKSLKEIMSFRRRRFSIKKILQFAIEIAEIIDNIHQAGWIWNDCKPANLIVSDDNKLRPIDFESTYQIGSNDPFDWKSEGFSKSYYSSEKSADLFALGAVIYFMLTGKLFDFEKSVSILHLRRNVPTQLLKITEKLLADEITEIAECQKEFEEILNQILIIT